MYQEMPSSIDYYLSSAPKKYIGGQRFRADHKMKRDMTLWFIKEQRLLSPQNIKSLVTLWFVTQDKNFCQHKTENLL